ncbi:MAG: cytochrome c3 family protein, partial [Bilophila sp.]
GTTSMNVSGVDADCRVCHATTKTEDLIAPRMKAFHSLCLKCHEAQGKGPFGKDQCNQCHMK